MSERLEQQAKEPFCEKASPKNELQSLKEKAKTIFKEQGFCPFQATFDEECINDQNCEKCPKNSEVVDSKITWERLAPLLVDAQQQFQELQVETKKLFKMNYELEGRLQRIREHIPKAPIPRQYISKEKDFDNFLRYITDARQWFETLKKLAAVQGEGDTK